MSPRLLRFLPPVLLLILALVGILLVALRSKELKSPPEYSYGIVVDAGSSHTAMYIYKWPADKLNGTGVVTQHSECHVPDKGISSYAGNRGGAANSLKICLDEALVKIPESRHRQTPLCLGATAGMRLLRDVNATESQRIMKEVEIKLRSYPFLFKEAVILSGQREGAYGWVSVNYLLENFIKYGFVGRWLNPGRETIGALDLGGASTQITFETSEKVESEINLMELNLYGQTYRLYTQSFLCYGQNQFLMKLLAHLIKTQGVKSNILHPCYPRLFNTTIKLGADVFDSPCTKNFRPAKFDPWTSVTMVGTGDYENCSASVKELFSFEKCPYSKCSFDGVFQPNVTGSFMAFAAYYFTHSYLTRLTNVTIKSPNGMAKAIRLVCNLSLSEMREKTKEDKKHLKNVCAVANFVYVLLINGYQFDEKSFPSITFQKKAGGTSVGWALGYMLNLSYQVPAEKLGLMKTLPPGNWAGILFLFIAILLFALANLLVVLRNARTRQDVV
ncbi:ectonucleoside triphosphate diphosphohydrolase 2-like [Gouania willdenowi]|uniref:Ectonucleoside triphosphate diphosphohydrolase 2-like n=1 Tax=Gouania willdenowi TaxID=441366 RepID=A0A8C5HJA0_GOUWI|nr:ectonucleoside triphosphate diphosphohydrolase 2-like [Gouania willdenowi]